MLKIHNKHIFLHFSKGEQKKVIVLLEKEMILDHIKFIKKNALQRKYLHNFFVVHLKCMYQ